MNNEDTDDSVRQNVGEYMVDTVSSKLEPTGRRQRANGATEQIDEEMKNRIRDVQQSIPLGRKMFQNQGLHL